MILAGDIGGTKANIAFFDRAQDRLTPVAERTFPSLEYDSLEDIVLKFLSEHSQPVDWACFGIAGPVLRGRSETTNLPWIVDVRKLAQRVGTEKVTLINDLEANAYGIAMLDPKEFVTLNEGAADAPGNAAVIAAGTGLGEAGLYWDGKVHRAFACEGGHTDFAPRTELEWNLLCFLRKEFGHVSWERVVSGPGLYAIYRFLRDTGAKEEPQWLLEKIEKSNPIAVVSEAGLERTSELCARALDLFVSFYGAEAGNLALKVMATGGLYVGGGIAPKILKRLEEGGFCEAFAAKGRYERFMREIPVRVILNEKAALLGAARYASLQVERFA